MAEHSRPHTPLHLLNQGHVCGPLRLTPQQCIRGVACLDLVPDPLEKRLPLRAGTQPVKQVCQAG